MEANAKMLAVVLLVAGLGGSDLNAQTPVGPGMPTPGAPAPPITMGPRLSGPAGPGKHHGRAGADHPDRRRPRSAGLISLTTVTGTVGQLLANDDFVFDGFMINTGSGTPMLVKFAPHLGQQVQKAIKSGSNVRVTGHTETRPEGDVQLTLTSLTVGTSTIVDTPPVAPTPTTPTLVTATGKVADYRLDRSGRVNGLVLDNKVVVRVPPHAAYQLTNVATKGSTITVQGYPKVLRDGQVQLEKTDILRASILTINGQQYLVR